MKLQFRISDEIGSQLDGFAEELGMSRSEYIREAVVQKIEADTLRWGGGVVQNDRNGENGGVEGGLGVVHDKEEARDVVQNVVQRDAGEEFDDIFTTPQRGIRRE